MGVKNLWPVLSPICEKKSLWELENTSIAIDLSAWICDSLNVTSPQRNMQLRNLFFRTNYLLLLGVKPVFVLEGEAPQVKIATIRKRMGKDDGSEKVTKHSRTRLKGLQNQCVQLLSYMGIACVKGRGEAEAYCAHLNQQGLVSGVVTQDSDAFLYGAKEVYRHFQMGPNYTCDCYKMDNIQEKLGLSRTKLIGFSILCGSDYNNGVKKVGQQTAVKFLSGIEDNQVYQKFIEWKNNSSFDILKNQKHISSDLQLELSIRDKAIKDPDFPYLDVISEYTNPPEEGEFFFSWTKPDLPKFLDFAAKMLAWDEEYALNKFIPLLGRWQLLNPHIETVICIKNILSWRKKDEPNSSFKVEWYLPNHETPEAVTTWELESNVSTAYPSLVESFKDSKTKKTKKKAANTDEKPVKRARKVKEKPTDENTIDKYVIKNKPKAKKKKNLEEDELNLSNILADIVSRDVSNPALLRGTSSKYL